VREQETLKHQLEVERNLCKLQLIQVRLQVFISIINVDVQLFFYISRQTREAKASSFRFHFEDS
jgi:hypothetical protein